MADKKQNTATDPEKSFFEKLGDQATHVKEELVLGKDHLVEFAGEAIDSVKSKIQEFKKRRAKPAKKAASKIKKQTKKVVAKKVIKTKRKKASSASKRKPAKKASQGKKSVGKKSAGPAKKVTARKRKK